MNIHDEDFYLDIVRKNIKKYREESDLTQQELADKIGISMNYLAKLESKKMGKQISIVLLGRIADALNIDIRDFFNK